MLIQGKTILALKEIPLMALEKHSIKQKDYNFKEAYNELLDYLNKKGGESHTWGYFPDFESDENLHYPECINLARQIEENFIKSLNLNNKPELAFIRVATKEPISDYTGLHVDVDIGVKHERDKSVPINKEIIRILINPYKYSRKLGYIKETRDELIKKGFGISKTKYKILKFLDEINIETIEIPPMERDAIYLLKFWSSIVPHCGITDEKGHFLIAYGMWSVIKNLKKDKK